MRLGRARTARRPVSILGPPASGRGRLAEALLATSPGSPSATADFTDLEDDGAAFYALVRALGAAVGRTTVDAGWVALASACEKSAPEALYVRGCEYLSPSFRAALRDLLDRVSIWTVASSDEALGLAGEEWCRLNELADDEALSRLETAARELDEVIPPSRLQEGTRALVRFPLALDLAVGAAAVYGLGRVLEWVDDAPDVDPSHEVHPAVARVLAALWDRQDEPSQRVLAALSWFRSGATAAELGALTGLDSEGVENILRHLRRLHLVAPANHRPRMRRELRSWVQARVGAALRDRAAEVVLERWWGPSTRAEGSAHEVLLASLPDVWFATHSPEPSVAVRAVELLSYHDRLMGLPGLGREIFDALVERGRRSGDGCLEVHALLGRAEWASLRGDFASAHADAVAAHDLAASGTDLALLAEARRAHAASRLGIPDRTSGEELAVRATSLSDARMRGKVIGVGAALVRLSGSPKDSARLWDVAREAHERAGAPLDALHAAINVGHNLVEADEFEAAKRVLESAQARAAALDVPEAAVACLPYLGRLYLELADIGRASDLLERVEEAQLVAAQVPTVTAAYNVLGQIAFERATTDRADRARAWMRKGAAFARSHDYAYGVASLDASLGLIELATGALSNAERCLGAALAFARRQGNARMEAEVERLSAVCALELGQPPPERRRRAATSRDVLLDDLIEFMTPSAMSDAPRRRRLVEQATLAQKGLYDDRCVGRLVLGVLKRRLGKRADREPDHFLEVDAAGERVRVDGGPPIDLSASPTLRTLLLGLLEQHDRTPGVPLTAGDLVALGWPDASRTDTAALNRVYDAMRRLRKMGLETVLTSSKAGYALRRPVRVGRAET